MDPTDNDNYNNEVSESFITPDVSEEEDVAVEKTDVVTANKNGDNSDFHLQSFNNESKMISLHSTAGRPAFDELIQASDTNNTTATATTKRNNYGSTGIYLCGPDKMISSCKKAAGMGCQIAGERLQMAARGNKFVFYEEKFEW